MIPLTMLSGGDSGTVQRVSGTDETRRFLESLGFVEGTEITVISENQGNLIVNVRDSRVAIDSSMANRIMV